MQSIQPAARPRPRRWVTPLVMGGLVLAVASSAAAHDLFLRLQNFFVPPNASVRVYVLNGTFSVSDAPVARNRVADISLVAPSGRSQVDTTHWQPGRDTTVLTLRTGEPGTYVIGASTLPRMIELDAASFNRYLETDGVPDVLEARRRSGELDRAARERYAKHVKAVVQVGDDRSAEYRAELGYPAELVPLDNPYSLRLGDTMRVRVLVDGQPVANQYVVAGGRTPNGTRLHVQNVRSDAEGVARIRLGSRGQYYVKFIHMVPVDPEPEVDYESKWATLTFEVR